MQYKHRSKHANVEIGVSIYRHSYATLKLIQMFTVTNVFASEDSYKVQLSL